MLRIQSRWFPLAVALALFLSLEGLARATSYVILVKVDQVRGCNELTVSDAMDSSPSTSRPIHLGNIECFDEEPDYLRAVESAVREISPDFSLEERDGRTSLVVFPPTQGARHNGANVALELVKAGLARATQEAPEAFHAAQEQARRDHLGWWPKSGGTGKPQVRQRLLNLNN
jgi:hypothetical protein